MRLGTEQVAIGWAILAFALALAITPSGGRRVAAINATTQGEIDFEGLDLRLEPGDLLVVAIRTVSSTATVAVGANWQEV